MPGQGVSTPGEHLHPRGDLDGQGHIGTPDPILVEPEGRFIKPGSFEIRIRSSARARRRWRSSRSGSCVSGPPVLVLVANAADPVPVDVGDPQLRGGVGSFLADDHPHPRWPPGHVHLSGTGFHRNTELPRSRLLGEGGAAVLGLVLDRWDQPDLAMQPPELNQSMYSATAISRSSMLRQGPLLRTSSALNREPNASARALSYDRPCFPRRRRRRPRRGVRYSGSLAPIPFS